MILIISSENDLSTSFVIDWLLFNKFPFFRVSEKDFLDIIEIDLLDTENCKFKLKNRVLTLSEITSIWYRRDYLSIKKTQIEAIGDLKLMNSIQNQLNEEKTDLLFYFLKLIKKKSLNSQFDNSLNKLEVLDACKKYGIKIPPSLITTRKESLISFMEKEKMLITKNFSQGVSIKNDFISMSPITIAVTREMADELPENFHPMLFQKMINKAFELRIFYLDGKFFTSAIFSQNDEKTKVDFRNYNFEKPNRTPPFELPVNIQKQLKQLMDHCNLLSGSIDMIVSDKGEFIFLEVNPVGQFSQVSHPCNYHLENILANYLINFN